VSGIDRLMLLLEQPAEVKASEEDARQNGWHAKWREFKLVAPLLLVSSFMFAEMVAYRLWLDDRLSSPKGLLHLLLTAAFIFLVLPILFAVSLCLSRLPWRWTKPAKRTIRLEEKGIRLSQTRNDRVWWKQVRRWFLAPIPDRGDLLTLTLECGSATKPSRRYWSIILEARDQRQAFLSELEHLRKLGRTEAPVVELLRPMPQRPVSYAGLWALSLAFLLLVHGFPLLLVGVLPHDTKEPPRPLSPPQQAKMEQLMRPLIRGLHISNERQLRLLFSLSGGLLTATAIGICVWSDRRLKRQLREINRLYDLELDKITAAVAAMSGTFESAGRTRE